MPTIDKVQNPLTRRKIKLSSALSYPEDHPAHKAARRLISKKKSKQLSSDTILGKKVGHQKGSNPGGAFEGKDGVKRYVKFYRDKEQGYSEHVSNTIYNDLNIGAPNSHIARSDKGEFFASDIIDSSILLRDIPSDKMSPIANKILDGFVADVLLSNWDVTGLVSDNIIIKDGEPYRIDNGGTLTFRAQGAKKGDTFTKSLSELDGLFNSEINRSYSDMAATVGVYGADDMKGRAKSQLKDILKLRNEYGGWVGYLSKKSPSLPERFKRETSEILEDRTRMLAKWIKS